MPAWVVSGRPELGNRKSGEEENGAIGDEELGPAAKGAIGEEGVWKAEIDDKGRGDRERESVIQKKAFSFSPVDKPKD